MTDPLVQARFQARMKAVEHPEKLTRTELRAKQEENLRLAREGYADRLHKEMAAQQGTDWRPWMNIERLYLDVQTGRNLDKVAEECFEFLPGLQGPLPAGSGAPATRSTSVSLSAEGRARPIGATARRSPAASLPGDAHEPGRPQGGQAGPGRARAGLSGGRRQGRSGRRALEGPAIRVPRRPGPAQGPGQAAAGLDRGRRRRQRLAADAGLSRGRDGPDPRRHPPLRGRPRGRRAPRPPTTARWPIGTWPSIAATPTTGPASTPSK